MPFGQIRRKVASKLLQYRKEAEIGPETSDGSEDKNVNPEQHHSSHVRQSGKGTVPKTPMQAYKRHERRKGRNEMQEKRGVRGRGSSAVGIHPGQGVERPSEVKAEPEEKGRVEKIHEKATGKGRQEADGLEILKHAKEHPEKIGKMSPSGDEKENAGSNAASSAKSEKEKKKAREQVISALGKIRSKVEDVEDNILHKKEKEEKEEKKEIGREDVLTVIFRLLGPVVVFLFPPSTLTYHSFLMGAVCLLAWFEFSLAWAVLAWVALEGIQVVQLAKARATKKAGVPFEQYREPAYQIVNPDAETLSWLNQIIDKVWRQVRKLLNNDVKGGGNKLLEEVFSGWRSRFLLHHFVPRITSLDIGEAAPWVTSIQSYTTEVDLVNANNKSLTIDVGLNFHVVPTISVGAGKLIHLDFDEVKFSAPFRFRFTPLLRDQTIFGQLQISVLHVPYFTYRTSGLLVPLSFPFIKHAVKAMVIESWKVILHPQKLIIPNPMVMHFTDHTVYTTRPIGALRVTLVEGDDMKPANYPVVCTCMANSDPYVIMKLGPKAVKTPVIKCDLNPRWNFKYEFPLSRQDQVYRELKLIAMDFDWGFWNDDDHIGFTTISIRRVLEEGKVDGWFRLCTHGGSGSLHLTLEFVPIIERVPIELTLEVPQDQRLSQAILVVLIYEVEMGRPITPLLVLDLSGRATVTTNPGYLSENWEFAEEFFLGVNNVKTDKLLISLVDYNAKVSFAKKTFNCAKNFIAKADDPQLVRGFERSNHFLMGAKLLEVDKSFTGFRQKVHLTTDKGIHCSVVISGRLFFLDNERTQRVPDLWYMQIPAEKKEATSGS